MKKLLKMSSFMAIIPVLLFGCAQPSKEADAKPASQSQTKKSDSSKDGKTKQQEKKEEKSSSITRKEPQYQPIKPSPDAKPLESNYDDEAIHKMPVSEAHGDTRDRSVPLGQTLLKNKKDDTEGPLKKYRIVSFYGNPHSENMGILGQYSPKKIMEKLKVQTKAYSDLDPKRPAIPAIELITTIAQRDAGPDGLYVHTTPKKDIETYAKLVKENHGILILDVQLGQDNIMHQVQLLKDYLKLPYVYLAIDTEFHVKKGQTPGVNLGHVYGENVQKAIDYVSDLTEKNGLPDKVVFVHQFADRIIFNKEDIHPAKHAEVVLNNDGFGGPGIKKGEYHVLVHNQPIQYGGFKLFYQKDTPLMSPKEVLELDPAPAFIDYQ